MNYKRIKHIQNLLAAARGDIPIDLLITGGRIINVFSGRIEELSVAIHNGIIVGFGDYDALETVDLKGSFLSPGFIDGHIHIESSKLTPSRFAEAVVTHGTTTVVSDPHEIANVLGVEGIRYMIEQSKDLPIEIFYTIPSCVPATNMETSGAILKADDLAIFLSEPNIVGLGEVMNYPGVVNGLDEVISKICLGDDSWQIDGHAPRLSGKELSAYLVSGASTDHECTDYNEALEKLSKGMRIMIREGSTARNLTDLLPLVTPETERRCMFVSDDRRPGDLFEKGHLDDTLRRAISAGLDAITAIRMVTLNPAETYGLNRRGGIAPGWQADLIAFDGLQNIHVTSVWKKGLNVVKDRKYYGQIRKKNTEIINNKLSIPLIQCSDLYVIDKNKPIRIIDIVENQIVCKQYTNKLTGVNGELRSDISKDILKLTVVERYSGDGRKGIGFVRGFGLKQGAIASTVAHDSHNIIATGVDDVSICTAVNHLRNIGGGQVVVNGDVILADLPLPIAGLMSDEPIEAVAALENILIAASHKLGCKHHDPFMTLSFLALPVIPELKLTDKGLIDVNRFEIVSLYV